MFFIKLIFFCLNIFLTFINILFLFRNNHKNERIFIKYMNKVKDSDLLPLFFIKEKYLEISKFLNSKYGLNKIVLKLNKTLMPKRKIEISNKRRKKIILYSVDLFSLKIHKSWLLNKLKDHFIIQFDSNRPDYLLYNVFGIRHLNPKYKNSIKIAIFTENKIPNLNEVDYAIGHYHINYLDRYFKYNIFFWKNIKLYLFIYFLFKIRNIKDIYISRFKALNSPKRIKFCAAVISNYKAYSFRIKFIKELSKYKKIDIGSKRKKLNNIGRKIINKREFLSSYKFSIAMENSEGDGYISEKIVDAFLAGTIPIYYGDYMIDEYINPKTYILIKGEKDILKKIEYIKEIDNNDELYRNLLKEKVLLDQNIVVDTEKELKEFLYHIFEQDKYKAYRKNF